MTTPLSLSSSPIPPPRVRLRDLLGDLSLAQALENVEQNIRRQPENMGHRQLRFDFLCLLGDWPKALVQLQTCAKLDPMLTPEAYVYRDLVQGELFRAEVFAGQRTPVLPESPPAWLSLQLEALGLQAQGKLDKADAVRERAFHAEASDASDPTAPPVASADMPDAEGCFTLERRDAGATDAIGVTSETGETGVFHWLTDSDSRLGPTLEVFVQGQYRWIPFARLTRIQLSGPTMPRDLVWLPVYLWLDGQQLAGFLPARYPGSEAGPDTVRLGRETRWQDVGQTGVIGMGQKVWTYDGGDVSLYDLRDVTFGSCAEPGTQHAEGSVHVD